MLPFFFHKSKPLSLLTSGSAKHQREDCELYSKESTQPGKGREADNKQASQWAHCHTYLD